MRKATVLVSAFVGFALVRGLAGCGATRDLIECEIDAVKVLPRDERQLTLGDLEDVRGRMHACKQAGADAGR
jgi:hypothetical protein